MSMDGEVSCFRPISRCDSGLVAKIKLCCWKPGIKKLQMEEFSKFGGESNKDGA